jgi:putative tryptophan/tyrosine transport system substrate-binding protein
LGNPDTPYTALALQQVRTAAATIGQPLIILEARAVDELPTAINAAIRSGAASGRIIDFDR